MIVCSCLQKPAPHHLLKIAVLSRILKLREGLLFWALWSRWAVLVVVVVLVIVVMLVLCSAGRGVGCGAYSVV